MRARQTILIAVVTMYIKAAEAIHALKLTEAIEWHFTCPSDELQKFCSFLFIE